MLRKSLPTSTKASWLRVGLVAVAVSIAGCSQPPQKVSTPTTLTPEEQALQVLTRTTGQQVEHIHFAIDDNASNNSWYQVSASEGELQVSASSVSTGTYGAYQYLRNAGALSVSWEGKRVNLPQQFADFTGSKVSTAFDYRTYLNVCAYGYTTPFWDWQRWEKEIDWMALHGVNNPVAMEGQEYVWQKLWQEFGVSDAELASYFSGPVFTPWQRMGNIEGHEGPLPQSWIDKKHQLQTKILERMKVLGMKPVVPAFSGYVPKAFVTLFPEAKITAMPKWTGFEHETYWLDPADPLFNKVAKRFIEIYTEAYGEHGFYLSDAFNEMLPPVSEDNRYEELASYGARIYDSIKQAAPNATWVMQGWMFGADEEFWDLDSIDAFLSKVPDEKAMIHDIGNDRYHVWQRTEGFKGKPWIFGFIHNYGGSDPVYADFGDYVKQLSTVQESGIKGNLSGFGVFPEGIHNNSVAYEFLFDLPWSTSPDIQEWVANYTNARYGKNTPALNAAWQDLIKGVYQVGYWRSRWWEGSAGAYLLFKRPTAEITEFGPHPGDVESLDKGIAQLLSLAESYNSSMLFTYDLVDFVKQSVSLHADRLLQQAVEAYQAGDLENGDAITAHVTSMVEKLDLLMGIHQESLHSWLSDAAAYADDKAQRDYYVHNARLQITQWGGPKLKDYASKAWQGMYADYYMPRWQLYLTQLRDSIANGAEFDDAAAQQAVIDWESAWIEQSNIPALTKPTDPIQLARELMALTQYSGN